MSGLIRGLIRSISETDTNTQTPQEKGISLARAVTLQHPPAPPSGPPSIEAIPSAGMDIEVEASNPPLQGQGFTANLALTIMIIDTLTKYIEESEDAFQDFLEGDINNQKKRSFYGGLVQDPQYILKNLKKGPFDKFHDFKIGDRNKKFARENLSQVLCDSARDAAIVDSTFPLDFTSATWGNVATRDVSKILHGVENPRNAKGVDERAIKAAVLMMDPSKYNFYFGPSSDLPTSLTQPEREAISRIVTPLSQFIPDLDASFPEASSGLRKYWIYDACIGTHIRGQLVSPKYPQVSALPNIWDPSKQGTFNVDASYEYLLSSGPGYQLTPIQITSLDENPYTVLQFIDNASRQDVYNGRNGIYNNTLNDNRIFKEAGIKIEIHMAVDGHVDGDDYKTKPAKAAIMISQIEVGRPAIYYAVVIGSGFSVVELSDILHYLESGNEPENPTLRYLILKSITNKLHELLRGDRLKTKTALTHLFLMFKYSGDDGTIEFARRFNMMLLSGDNMAFTSGILGEDSNVVGSYLKIKSQGEKEDAVGEEDDIAPNRPQFFVTKLVPGNVDSYATLIEGVRSEIISGLNLPPSALSSSVDTINGINTALETLLAGGDFFSNPGTMISRILAIPNINLIASTSPLPTGLAEIRVFLSTLKKINMTVSFALNYSVITGTLDKMASQMVKELPPRVSRRNGTSMFLDVWNRVSKTINKGSTLEVAIQQVDEALEKNLAKMEARIREISEVHLKKILELDANMVLFVEQHMKDYRRAAFSAEVVKWMGNSPSEDDKEFARALIARVAGPGMMGGISTSYNSIKSFMISYIFIRTQSLSLSIPGDMPLTGSPKEPRRIVKATRRGGRKITKKYKRNKRSKKTRKQNIK